MMEGKGKERKGDEGHLAYVRETLLMKDKERSVKGLAEDIEGYLNVHDFRPAF